MNTSNNSVESKVEFELYPNPSNLSITLKYDLSESDNALLVVFDVAGKIVAKYEMENSINEKSINLDVSEGVYFAQLIINNSIVQIRKLIVNK